MKSKPRHRIWVPAAFSFTLIGQHRWQISILLRTACGIAVVVVELENGLK